MFDHVAWDIRKSFILQACHIIFLYHLSHSINMFSVFSQHLVLQNLEILKHKHVGCNLLIPRISCPPTEAFLFAGEEMNSATEVRAAVY